MGKARILSGVRTSAGRSADQLRLVDRCPNLSDNWSWRAGRLSNCRNMVTANGIHRQLMATHLLS